MFDILYSALVFFSLCASFFSFSFCFSFYNMQLRPISLTTLFIFMKLSGILAYPRVMQAIQNASHGM